MIQTMKWYRSGIERYPRQALLRFFSSELSKSFGPVLRETLVDNIIKIIESLYVDKDKMKPGQILWNALDKNTRGDSINRRFVPVILTVIDENDIEQLAHGEKMSVIAQNSIARMISETYEQGGALSMRDIGLLTLKNPTSITTIRKQYEQRNNVTLPHTGVLHDMGSCITHKKMIVKKIVAEKKDPATVARETHHSQKAVDRYLTDYKRVETAFSHNKNVDYIQFVTGISKHVVKQYIELIHEIEETV